MKRLLFALLMSCSLAWGQGLDIIGLRHRSAEQLLPALQGARSEALSGFGNGDLLIERGRVRELGRVKSARGMPCMSAMSRSSGPFTLMPSGATSARTRSAQPSAKQPACHVRTPRPIPALRQSCAVPAA